MPASQRRGNWQHPSWFRNGGRNPISLVAETPRLGGELRGTVDLTTTGHASAAWFGSAGRDHRLLPNGFALLIDVDPATLLFALPPREGPLARFALPLPRDARLSGIRVHTQAVHLGGETEPVLSNAQDLVLGF